MKNVFFLFVFLTCLTTVSCQTNNFFHKEDDYQSAGTFLHPEFKKYFDKYQVDGSIAIYDNDKKTWILSDTEGVNMNTLPASTFKIINMLIALETRAVASEDEVVAWPGITDTVKYGYRPDIYHDISVKNAFEVSAGWTFIEIAKRIDRSCYKKYLEKSEYGNTDVSEEDVDFWNFGKLGISPLSQVKLFKKLYDGNLPFSKKNMDIVKRVMITEQNPEYTIRSKTGWTMANSINTGWWVGYIQTKDNVYFFATRLLQDRKNNRSNFGMARKEITKMILRDLRIIK